MSPEKQFSLKKENASTSFLRDFEGNPQEYYSYLGAERHEAKLDNGLKVVLLKKPGTKISVLAGTVGGARHDKGDLAGRAHFNEHMITSGTEKYPNPQSLSKSIEDEGGYFEAYTSREEMGVDIRVNHLSDFQQALEIASECLTKSIYDPDIIESERGAVREEIGISNAIPADRVWTEYQNALFPDTPLATSVLGNKRTVGAFTRDVLMGHSQEMFVARKMALVIAGNIPFEQVMDYADKSFRNMPSGDEIEKAIPLPDKGQSDDIKLRRYKDTDRVIFNLGFRTTHKLHADNAALEVLAEAIGGGGASMLIKKLRYDKGTGFAYGTSAHHDLHSDAGALVVNCSTAKDNLQKVFDITTDLLKDVRENGLAPEVIEFTKNRLTKLQMGALERASSWAIRHSSSELLALRTSQNLSEELNYPLYAYIEQIAKVTPDDVSRVAQEYLKSEKLRLAICGNVKREDFKIKF